MSDRFNPFPGPRPYREDEQQYFFGRSELAADLSNRALAYRGVIVYGPSGGGKSSLIKASLIPALKKERNFRIVLIDGWPRDQPPAASLLDATYTALGLGARERTDSSANSMRDALKRAVRRSDDPILLVCDQAEQLLQRRDIDELTEVLSVLDIIVRAPVRGVHLVLSLREDYLGRLRDRARYHIELLEQSIRIGPLTVREMADAVLSASVLGRPHQDWNAETVRSMLMEVRSPEQLPTEDAEVQAAFGQILSRELWDEGAFAARAASRTSAKAILERYLERTLESLGDRREDARRLLEEHLVDPDGNRAILTEREARKELPADADIVLDALEGAAVLTATEHHGGRYFELGHDWLAARVTDRRAARVEAQLLAADRDLFVKRFLWTASLITVFVLFIVGGLVYRLVGKAQEIEFDKNRRILRDCDEDHVATQLRAQLRLEAGDSRLRSESIEEAWRQRNERIASDLELRKSKCSDETAVLTAHAARRRSIVSGSENDPLEWTQHLEHSFRLDDDLHICSTSEGAAAAVSSGTPDTAFMFTTDTGSRRSSASSEKTSRQGTLYYWHDKSRDSSSVTFTAYALEGSAFAFTEPPSQGVEPFLIKVWVNNERVFSSEVPSGCLPILVALSAADVAGGRSVAVGCQSEDSKPTAVYTWVVASPSSAPIKLTYALDRHVPILQSLAISNQYIAVGTDRLGLIVDRAHLTDAPRLKLQANQRIPEVRFADDDTLVFTTSDPIYLAPSDDLKTVLRVKVGDSNASPASVVTNGVITGTLLAAGADELLIRRSGRVVGVNSERVSATPLPRDFLATLFPTSIDSTGHIVVGDAVAVRRFSAEFSGTDAASLAADPVDRVERATGITYDESKYIFRQLQ